MRSGQSHNSAQILNSIQKIVRIESFSILLSLLLFTSVQAQTVFVSEDTTAVSFINNRIYLSFDNKGVLADVNTSPHGSMLRYDDYGVSFSGGFALSGKLIDSIVWANGVMTADFILDYLPGPVGSEPDNPKNKIYILKSSEPDFSVSWHEWKNAVEQGAYFYDGDNDGQYNPVDKNGNGSWDSNEDKPDLLYDLTFFTVFNDGVPNTERRYDDVYPIGIEVRQTIFVSTQNTILDDVIFIRYSIIQREENLDSVYFSFWNDADIGDAVDDLFGSDTSLQSLYYYNEGSDNYFGVNPPSIFTTILQGPIVKSNGDEAIINFGPTIGQNVIQDYKNLGVTHSSGHYKSSIDSHKPNTRERLRFYQRARDLWGNLVDPCTYYYGKFLGEGCENANPIFWYSGDPVTQTGWLDKISSDIRGYVTTGPFTLKKNNPTDIITAYIVARGTDSLDSIVKSRELTQYVHEEYARNFSTIVGVEDEAEEVVNTFSLLQNYPNPFNPTTTIKYSVETQHAVSLQVYNILGQKVKTLVNEVKAPGSYQVTFDASQLASGVYFYRLTSGPFVQTKKMILLR